MAINLDKFIWVERIIEGRKNPHRQKKFLHTCEQCGLEGGFCVKTWDITRSNGLCVSCTKLELGPTVNKGLCYICNEKPAIANKRCGSCNSKMRDNLKKREWARLNQQKRIKNDVKFKLTRQLRSRLYGALNGDYKIGSAVQDLGCTVEELKKYLESKFKPGMDWNNWSKDGWHIDHIKPLASFDLSDLKQFKKACHYTNLQPLWAFENLRKGNKIGN